MASSYSNGSKDKRRCRIWKKRRPSIAPSTAPGHRLDWPGSQFVQPIEGSDFISLSQGRIVENCVTKILDCASHSEHHLSDVYDLRSAIADSVHAQQLQRIRVKEQL